MSGGVKGTPAELASLGADALLLTPPPASADGLVKEARQARPTEGRRPTTATAPSADVSVALPNHSRRAARRLAEDAESPPERAFGEGARRVSNLRPLACEGER